MKRLIIAAVVTATIFGLLSPPSATAAQIVNGSFEDGLNGWFPYCEDPYSTISISSQWQTDGLQSARLESVSVGGGSWYWNEEQGIWVPYVDYVGETSRAFLDQIVQIPDDVLTICFDWRVDYFEGDGGGLFEVWLDISESGPSSSALCYGGFYDTGLASGTEIIDISEYAGEEVLLSFYTVAVVSDPEPPPGAEPGWDEWFDVSAGFLYLDNVHLSTQTVIPEPATVALLAPALLGLAGIAFRRMRRGRD